MMNKIEEGKKLMNEVLNAMDMNLEEFLVNAIANSACYTNEWVNYWNWKEGWNDNLEAEFQLTDKCREDRIAVAIINNYVLVDIEDGTKRKVTLDDVYRGIADFNRECPDYYNEYIMCGGDAITDYLFLQCVVFGEIIYG